MIQYKNIAIISGKYKQIQWLNTCFSSNGGAFVNTQIFDLDGRYSRIEMDAVWIDSEEYTEWSVLFCSQVDDNYPGTIQVRRHMISGSNLVANTNDNVMIAVEKNIPFHVILEGNQFTVGEKTVTTSMPETSSKSNLIIGKTLAPIVQQQNARCWPGFIGEAKVYSNEQLISHFIPMLEIPTKTYGYYDIISEKFFPSDGEVPFTEGVL